MKPANQDPAAGERCSRRTALVSMARWTGWLALPLLSGCDAVFDSDMANLKADMQDAYRRRHMNISKFMLTRDTRYQVSGMIYIDVEYQDGVKTYYVPCVAKMDPVTRRFNWSCESLP